MHHGYWQERWDKGEIGFHASEVNPLLIAHAGALAPGIIYVPMCGKSRDLTYLAERGFVVVGSEWVPEAAAAYFAEAGVIAVTSQLGPFACLRAPELAVSLLVGDAFALGEVVPSPHLPLFDSAYDRASLVAIDPARRRDYVDTMYRVLRPGGTLLLVTFDYDQQALDGPPWSIDDALVHSLFASRFEVQPLEQRPAPVSPRFAAAGITEVREAAYLLRRLGGKLDSP